ncbi:hypothetical protein [Halopiger djelfimassiliensis]|uniref:hypothetical protein n=1 Tax=Halopiger djelfimassiliensis TaxID=1293047 RepID=UPI000677AC5F|nr:hypothetical protein [Halopiger djelfimassiliensis]
MGDKKFTLIELHLDGDSQFGPRTIGDLLPFGEPDEPAHADLETVDEDTSDERSDEAVAADGGGNKGAIGALIALAVLVVAGVAIRKFRGDEESELEQPDEPDVVVN